MDVVLAFHVQKRLLMLQEISAVVRKIDDEFEKQWQNQNLQVAKPADNLLVARRISLGLTGTIPSLEEIRQFEKIPAPQQIDWWTRYLLDDRRSSDYLAERLARAYVGVENGPFIVYRRRRFVSWLSEQLRNPAPLQRTGQRTSGEQWALDRFAQRQFLYRHDRR